MASRRMFKLEIIDTDQFIEMPISARLLYYDMSMRADDDGFVGAPKKILRMIGCSEDDLKILIAKNFVIAFDSGICVIKHWKSHNAIKADRYKETLYLEEKATLTSTPQCYQIDIATEAVYIQNGDKAETKRRQSGDKTEAQDRLGKDRLGKDRLGKDRLGKDRLGKDRAHMCQTALTENTKKQIITAWSRLNIMDITSINNTRATLLLARIKEHGIDKVLEAIENIGQSSFLRGNNNKGWIITFDWFVKPNNFIKVFEKTYADKESKSANNGFKTNTAANAGATEIETSATFTYRGRDSCDLPE